MCVCVVCLQIPKYKTLTELVQQAQCSKQLKISRVLVSRSTSVMCSNYNSFSFFKWFAFMNLGILSSVIRL